MFEKQKTKQKGSALLFATILLFVVLSMVVSLTYVTVMEQKMSGRTKSSVGAFFNADSGVEWALNKIANVSGDPTLATAFSVDANGKAACPDFGSGSPCSIYFLGENGEVLTSGNVSDIKAVRAVGTQGSETQRAIEAAVAGGVSCRIIKGDVNGQATCGNNETLAGGGYSVFADTACQLTGLTEGGVVIFNGPAKSSARCNQSSLRASDNICVGSSCKTWMACGESTTNVIFPTCSFAICCE